MIERYVFVKLKDDLANPAGRNEVAAYSRAALAGLPGVRDLRVGTPADGKAEVWDLSIAVRFDDLEAAGAFHVHPDHRAYVEQYLVPRMQVVKAWNFAI